MATDRLIAILTLLRQHKRTGHERGRLCAVAAEVTEQSGAGIALVSKDGELTSMCASNKVAQRLMDLEITVGEGPCVDASRSFGAVEELELLSSSSTRWLAYSPSAGSAGARAVFGFPLCIGAICLGALSLYRDQPGPLTDAQASDAHLMASVAARAIVSMQAGAAPDMIGDELAREGTFDFAVHQAAGMVSVQGSMSVGDALVALRAHAFTNDCTSSTLALRIVARELCFDRETLEWRDAKPGRVAFDQSGDDPDLRGAVDPLI
jgi:hypothetical protein